MGDGIRSISNISGIHGKFRSVVIKQQSFMATPIKPLRECIRATRDRIAKDFDKFDTEKLLDVLYNCDAKILFEKEDGTRVDAARAVSWHINAALTRRGIPPSSRRSLGSIHKKSTKFIHDVRKLDAPYIDLQWLAFKYPECIPKKWSCAREILTTAPGMKISGLPAHSDDEHIIFGISDPDESLDAVFDHADRLVNRKLSVSRLCRAMKLSVAAQSEMRWLCSRYTRKLVGVIDDQACELAEKMRKQDIKQLKPELIDARVQMFRAWKLAGGGTNWQAAADILKNMTGVRKTRQAIRDMITRMGEQKLIRRRKGKKRALEPLLEK
jgi:hypothetical protein